MEQNRDKHDGTQSARGGMAKTYLSTPSRHAYLHLKGQYAQDWRKTLRMDFLPIMTPVPEQLDGGEYGMLSVLYVDATRLSAEQQTRLIEWIWRQGDNPERKEIAADVLANKAAYLLNTGDESEIMSKCAIIDLEQDDRGCQTNRNAWHHA